MFYYIGGNFVAFKTKSKKDAKKSVDGFVLYFPNTTNPVYFAIDELLEVLNLYKDGRAMPNVHVFDIVSKKDLPIIIDSKKIYPYVISLGDISVLLELFNNDQMIHFYYHDINKYLYKGGTYTDSIIYFNKSKISISSQDENIYKNMQDFYFELSKLYMKCGCDSYLKDMKLF